MLRLTFALSHGREAQERLLDRFNQISDPSSPLFRQHMTRAEVTALLRGGDGGEGEAAAAVRRFLVADHGIDPAAVRLAGNEDFVVAHVDAGKAEGILSTGLVSLRDREGRRRRIRSLAPARLPEGVARHVDWIGGVPPPLEEDEGPAATRPGGRDRGRRRRLPEGWAEVPSMASRPPSPGGGLPAPTPVGGGGLHTRRAAGLSAGGPVAAIPQPWRGESPAVMVMVRCPDWAPGRTMDRAGDCGGGIAVTDLTVALDPDQDGGSALSVTIHAQSFPTHCLPCRGFGQGGYLGQGLQYVCQNLLGESLLCEGDSCGDKDRHRDPHRDHAADEEPAEASSLVACFVPLPRQDASLPSSLVGRMSALRTEVHFREPGAPPGAPPRPARGGCFAGARVFECMDRGLVLQPDVTPELLRGLYRVPPDMRGAAADTAPGGGGGSGGQAVIEFLEQSYSPVDLSSFLMENNIRTREPVAELTTVCGGDFFLRNATDGSQIPTQCQNPSDPGSEGTLDLQMLLGMAPGVHTEFWSFGGRRDQNLPASSVNQEPFLDYFVALASHEDPPLVHSVSYDDLDLDVPAAYRERLDLEFAKAGARGISLLFAAGDDGVGGETLRNGEAAAAENGRLCRPFRVGWPASSPYVTSVGGTAFGVAAGGGIGEVAAHSATGSMVTTSGGFSTLYEREDLAPWQARHCEHYLAPASAPGAPPPGPGAPAPGAVLALWTGLPGPERHGHQLPHRVRSEGRAGLVPHGRNLGQYPRRGGVREHAERGAAGQGLGTAGLPQPPALRAGRSLRFPVGDVLVLPRLLRRRDRGQQRLQRLRGPVLRVGLRGQPGLGSSDGAGHAQRAGPVARTGRRARGEAGSVGPVRGPSSRGPARAQGGGGDGGNRGGGGGGEGVASAAGAREDAAAAGRGAAAQLPPPASLPPRGRPRRQPRRRRDGHALQGSVEEVRPPRSNSLQSSPPPRPTRADRLLLQHRRVRRGRD